MSALAFTAGTAPPLTLLPPGACDCHMHLYDGRYPAVAGARLTPPDASLGQYRALQQRLGLSRAVCVTPSTYGTDNRCLVDALAGLGDTGRGVAVIDLGTSDAQLEQLDRAGVRGIRVNLSLGVSASPGMLLPLARRIARLGWHLQLIAPPAGLLALEPLLEQLPVPLVLDHFAKIAPSARAGAAHALVTRLLREGRAWVKLSGAYLVGESPAHDGSDMAELARDFIATAPHRMLWASNWPHATASAGHHPWPDDAASADLLADWCGDAGTLEQVLVRNPAELYGFDRFTPR